jgi:hypothetical protein
MRKIGRAFIGIAPLAMVALSLVLVGQDKGPEVCQHVGRGGVAFDPDEAIANLRRIARTGKLELGSIASPSWVKLPACTKDATWERAIDGLQVPGFEQIVFVDEASFPKLADRIRPGAFVLFVSGGSVADLAKLAEKAGVTRWGLASRELVELFDIRCVPAIVVPLGRGRFRVSSVTQG